MKLSISAVGAVVAMLLTAPVDAVSEKQACYNKHPAVVNAIGKFCAKTDIVVPSSYAYNGAFSGPAYPNKARVNIQGFCNPKQWVPQKYCYSQLYHICAAGDKHGQGSGHYGRNACQQWFVVNIYD